MVARGPKLRTGAGATDHRVRQSKGPAFMEQVKIKIGSVTFHHPAYDADSDVLFLHVGAPQVAEGEEKPEGHVLRYAPGTQNIVGLTAVGARRLLDRDGHLPDPIPEPIEASAADLAPALAA